MEVNNLKHCYFKIIRYAWEIIPTTKFTLLVRKISMVYYDILDKVLTKVFHMTSGQMDRDY